MMENFVVSARKYRPASFASVVGQDHITSTLKNAIERGQLSHAYLFCGPRGVGKTTCARIFAKAINCLSPRGSEPCGECESCVGFESGRSMNIHELDAASNNSVEDIRALIEQVRIIPQVGRYALFIIDEVHMLSTAAFNAFLKTLEEPPAHAIFILATTERHKILPTIISRCQCYDFNRIRVEDGAKYLRHIAQSEGVEVDDESLNLIAQKADGGMRDALSMFDKAVSFGGTKLDYRIVAQSIGVVDYDTYFRIVDALLVGDYGSALVTFDEVLSMGFGASSFLVGLSRHLRDLLVARDAKTCHLMELTESLMARYREQGAKASVDLLFGAINVLATTDGELKRSSNQRLLVELGLMKIASLGQKKNIELPPLAELRPNRQTTVVVEQPQPQPVVAEPEPVVVEAVKLPEPEVVVEQPKTVVKRARRASALFSIKGVAESAPEVESGAESSDSGVVRKVDPESEAKLTAARGVIVGYIEEWRPRFEPFFVEMKIEGNNLVVEVPNGELRDEIRRNEIEMLTRIVELAQVDGVVELDVKVVETMRVARPIKLEDRVAHFNRLNPLVAKLCEELDMQVDG